MKTYAVMYLGHVIEGDLYTKEEAFEARSRIVDDVMADRVPDFLTSDDFDDRGDCIAQMRVVALTE
jgi:hypothetical protein